MFALLLAAVSAIVSGCGTTESQNMSERPWNAPVGWENGIPSSMTQGR